MKTNKKDDLLLKALDGDLSHEEQGHLERLLDASPEARQMREEHISIHKMVAEHGQGSFQPGFADRVMDALPEASTGASAKIFQLSANTWLRAAAVVLILIGVSTITWMQPREYTVPNGQQAERLLPDGTTVLLSSGSSIHYKPFWGRQSRTVYLEGEAFFDVAKTGKPFIVETFNAEVRVLGTRFNVKAWPASFSNYTAVTLEEGRVEVSATDTPQKTLELAPSQSTVIYADSTHPDLPRAALLRNSLAWRIGGLGFEDEPLANVAADLQRRYNVRLEVPAELQNRRIAYIKPTSVPLDTVLTDLSQTFKFKYRPIANGYQLFVPDSF